MGIPVFFYSNENKELQDQLITDLQLDPNNLPIIIIGNASGEVVFVKQGYTIGLGEQLLTILSHIEIKDK